jgi:hypothetical protein
MDKDYRREFESIQQPPLPLFKVGTDGSHQPLTLKGRVILFLNEETFPKRLSYVFQIITKNPKTFDVPSER